MKKKSLALLFLALGSGLVASLGITQVLKRGEAPPSDTAPVYVARADIAAGALITPDNANLEQWPKDRAPAGALTRQEDIDGRRARRKIYAGEPFIEPKLLGRGEVPTDSMVPKGLRVVPVSVNAEAIHSGLVLPGSRCDVQVFMRADPKAGIGETVCKTILQDIRVFAVNDVTSTESLDPKSADTRSIPTGRTVSLLVTPVQAQIVTLASQLGSIRLILRSGEDNEQPKAIVMTAHELLGASGGGDRGKEDPSEASEERFRKWAEMIKKSLREEAKAEPVKTAPSEEPMRFTMRIRAGADVNDVLLVNNSSVQGLAGDEGAWTVTGLGTKKASSETHVSKPLDPELAGPAAAAAAAAAAKSAAGSQPPPTKPVSPQPPGA